MILLFAILVALSWAYTAGVLGPRRAAPSGRVTATIMTANVAYDHHPNQKIGWVGDSQGRALARPEIRQDSQAALDASTTT